MMGVNLMRKGIEPLGRCRKRRLRIVHFHSEKAGISEKSVPGPGGGIEYHGCWLAPVFRFLGGGF